MKDRTGCAICIGIVLLTVMLFYGAMRCLGYELKPKRQDVPKENRNMCTYPIHDLKMARYRDVRTGEYIRKISARYRD